MNISDKGLNLIKSFEGLRLTAYRDAVGIWTIGYGHIQGVHQGMAINGEEAEQLLRDDVAKFEHGVEDMASECTQGQFDALVSFAFNLGLSALKTSTLLRLHKAGDYVGAEEQFMRWTKAGGRVLPGLVRRRAAEAELYES